MAISEFLKKSERTTSIYVAIWGLLFIPGFLFCLWCIHYEMDQLAGAVVFGWMMAFLIPACAFLGTLGVLYLVEKIKQPE